MNHDPTQQTMPTKRGCSPIAAVLVGCGTVFLLGIVGLGVAGFLGYRWASNQVEQFTSEFEEKGYEQVMGQLVEETDPIDSSRVYVAQMVIIRDEVNADLAIMAQSAEIHGTVAGDIDFMGQVLTIKPGAVVKGDIRSKAAQQISVQGSVEGTVTGSYQILERADKNNAGRPPDAEEEPSAPGDAEVDQP